MHTCPNGKRYIGITRRRTTLRWGNGCNYSQNPYFYNAIKKYGWEKIDHEILYEKLTKEEAEQKEIELISKYKSNQRKYGYNLSSGGHSSSGLSYTDEQREVKRKFWNEYVAKNGHPAKGKKHSPEFCTAISKRVKGVKKPDGTGAKISKALTGRKLSKQHYENVLKSRVIIMKPIMQMDLDGNEMQHFDSATNAARFLGVREYTGHIAACCKGKLKSAYGYK